MSCISSGAAEKAVPWRIGWMPNGKSWPVNFQSRQVQGEETPCDPDVGCGFEVIAYPARYGLSGGMSFLVNQDGAVYAQSLGNNTTLLASKMNTFNPDASWRRVPLLAKARSR
jgi:hypothetical protein